MFSDWSKFVDFINKIVLMGVQLINMKFIEICQYFYLMVMKINLAIAAFYLLFFMSATATIPIQVFDLSLKSYYGTYLSGNQDGTVSLKYNL